jgi:alpha-glucuronidase
MIESLERLVPANEDGSDLWLRYRKIATPGILERYRASVSEIFMEGAESSKILSAAREELFHGLSGILGGKIPVSDAEFVQGSVIAGTPSSSPLVKGLGLADDLAALGPEGFIIRNVEAKGRRAILIASSAEKGVLYGSFAFLRILQTEGSIAGLDIRERPRVALRQIDHWETERCYAGGNVWDWDAFPGRVDRKYRTYARAHASIGVNSFVLNNVNAQRKYLTREYLEKEAALAELFRQYGISVFLSANFSAPVTLGGLKTADPADPAVLDWWKVRSAEIRGRIPDFGGFVVKANSEGEPGPKDYGRTHADGANLLADALAPLGCLVLWRAFVYDADVDEDRLKRSYKEFVPLDGKFRPNVLVQAKNGPLDFQPREPFNPLFGKMPRTPLAMEFQISQEYLGQSDHLVYLAPMWKEVLDADTGNGFTVAEVVDGTAHGSKLTAIAAVANTGSDANWCGHHFHQANLYAFGRLAWDHSLASERIADEWTRMAWGNGAETVSTVTTMMLGSHEACVDYMTPLGLGHIMARDRHYGPEPDDTVPGHLDWSPTYYHKADAQGLGYDRTRKGSGLVDQYFKKVADIFDSEASCPEELLCWFHHVPWKRRMNSGRTFWEELCHRYGRGLLYVVGMQAMWESLRGLVDDARMNHVEERLKRQEENARLWRDTCLKYFQEFSGMPIPPLIREK